MIATGIYYGQYTFGSYDLNLKARAHTQKLARARARSFTFAVHAVCIVKKKE